MIHSVIRDLISVPVSSRIARIRVLYLECLYVNDWGDELGKRIARNLRANVHKHIHKDKTSTAKVTIAGTISGQMAHTR
jgi:hypothetical protein